MPELFDIFNIRTDFMNFCDGIFIEYRDEEDYRDLLASMIPEQHRAHARNKKKVLEEAFALLFSYKCAAMTLLRHTEGILVGGLGTSIAYHAISKVNKVIETRIEEIDNILWEIIDPKKKTVTVSPDDNKYLFYDLSEIDIAYM